MTTLKQSEHDLNLAREQLAGELRRTQCLQALGLALLEPHELSVHLHHGVRAAVELTGAETASVQLVDPYGQLAIVAHEGFDRVSVGESARVMHERDSVVVEALAGQGRVVVEDIDTSPLREGSPSLAALRAAGVRAVQFTPLLDRSRARLGTLCTHYREPHAFGDAEQRWLDLLASGVALAIERDRLDEQLRTAMRALELQVADQTRDLRNALEGANAGAWHIDLRSMTTQWDERTRMMFGRDTSTFQFNSTFPEVHPDDRDRLQKRFQQLQSPGDDLWDMTFRVELPTGVTSWIHGVGRVVRDANGHPVAFNGINLDVTREQETSAALRAVQVQQSEAAVTIERLLDGAAEGILATTEAGTIERANRALEAMFGYGPGELDGQPLERLIPEALRAQHSVHHATFWTEPRTRPMGVGLDLTGQRKDGTTFPIEVSLTYVATSSGGRVMAFVADISERKRVEAELRRNHAALQAQADQLRHRTEQLRRLASDLTISEQQTRERLARTVHDHLQQVLFAAGLRADRLVAALPGANVEVQALAGKVREDLEVAIQAARSLSVELFPPTLHQGGLGAGLIWLGHWMKESYGLTVDVTIDPRATVAGIDQKDLRTLAFESVRELLFDVVKHARVNRATLTLTMTPDDQLRLEVADEGIGFDPAVALQAAGQSTGWGLFSIQERASLLGGHFEIDSAPGRGTRSTLLLPTTDVRRRAAERPLRILIADDHAVARAGLREILTERTEFEIVGEASTGVEAIALAQTLKPDAVIMDVAIPEIDGIEATRRIRQALPDIQILGLSTQERPDGLHAIEAAGAVGYFTKGDDAQRLIDRLLRVHAIRTPRS